MKNRKTIIVAFVLVACMLVGVGYAALSDTFLFEGHATVSEAGAEDAFNEDVVLLGIVRDGVGGSDVVSDVTDISTYGYTASCNVAEDKASYHVYSLKGQTDSKTIVFRIKNEGDLAATLDVAASGASTNNNTEYFDVTYSLADNSSTALAAGATVDVAVTVTLKQTPETTISGDFTFTFVANSAGTP